MRTPRAIAVAVVLVAALVVASGCRRHARSEGPWMMVTQTNLHPNPETPRLYSVNYLEGGLIPVCTPVRIDVVTEREARFTDLNTNVEYRYVFHERSMAGMPIQKHMDLYFGTTCPSAAIDSLPAIDRQGIQQGQALPGMTKQGVIVAIGYPPPHETPSLDADEWKYWTSRFGTQLVRFQNGQVVDIVH